MRTALDRVERAEKLDLIANPVRSAVRRLLPDRARDVLNGVWLGHPLHPALVQVPAGAWLSASVLDVLPGGEPGATVLVGVGTAGALPAAAAGWADWSGLAPEQRRVGLVHAGANLVAVGLQAASFVLRCSGRRAAGRAVSLAALTVAGASAYVGAHLAYRQAAGVNHAAPMLRHIPTGWHRICDSEDLHDDAPIVRMIGEVPVLLVRDGDEITAMLERCAHQGGPLGEGKVVTLDDEVCVICPWHGSTYRLRDGAVRRGPAATSQPTLRVRVAGGQVEVAAP